MATIKNFAADLAGKTLLKAEDSQVVTGAKSFQRAPDPPFDVEVGSAVVPNLDADLLDGEHGADYHDAALLVGTVPATCLPDPLPASSAENLVNIPAANLTGPLPASSAENLVNIPAANLTGPVPAASLPTIAPIVQTVSSTGTVNDLALDAETTDLLCDNATALVLTGLAGGSAGRRVFVHATGAGSVKVAHQNAGSAEANRAVGVSTAGQILGQGGLLLLVYDNTASRWRIYLVDAGAPILVAFAGGNFTASGAMTWTVAAGDVYANRFTQVGRWLIWDVWLYRTAVGGTPSTALRIALPAGLVAAGNAAGPCSVIDNGTARNGYYQADDAGTFVSIYPAQTGGNWAVSAGLTTVAAQFRIQVA